MHLPFTPRPLASPLSVAPVALVLAAALGIGAAPAEAAPTLVNNLITNGDFSDYTVNNAPSTTSYIVTGGQTSGSGGAKLTGWVNTGYTFVFQPNTASATGATVNSTTQLYLWGPDGTKSSTYSNNGFVSSPTGGAFIAEDGAYQTGYLAQQLTNLTVGQTYALSFNWGAAQQAGYNNATTEAWNVYWADASNNVASSFATQTINNPEHGFSGWFNQTYNVVATTTTMTLAFMATGTPGGSPPFSLLDGVSLVAAPEPAAWALLGSGLVGLALVRRRKRRA